MADSSLLYEQCKRAYLNRVSLSKRKYHDYSFLDYPECKVVLDLVLDDKYPKDIVYKVVRNFSKNIDEVGERDFDSFFASCDKIFDRYDKIYHATPEDAYCFAARQYLVKNHLSVLTGKDDINICSSLFENVSEDDLEDVGRAISRSLLEQSPVSVMSSRNPDDYSYCISHLAYDKYENNRFVHDEQKQVLYEHYEHHLNNCDRALKEKGFKGLAINPLYYHGLVARSLVKEHFSIDDICDVMSDFLSKESNISMSSQEVNNFITSNVKVNIPALLHREYLICAFEWDKNIKKDLDLDNLLAAGVTLGDIYMQSIKERSLFNPSTEISFHQEFLDVDIVENIMMKYKDISKDQIIMMLRDNSPRSLMPGISPNYPEQVYDQVLLRNKRLAEELEGRKEVAAEFRERCKFMSNGITNKNDLSLYSACVAAIDMLKSGHSVPEIKLAFNHSASVLNLRVKDKSKIIDSVVKSAHASYNRLNKIKNFTPVPEVNSSAKATNLFMESMQNSLNKGLLSTGAEALAVAGLICFGFSAVDVMHCLSEYSPFIVQAGRDSSYPDYVYNYGLEIVNQDQLKLERLNMAQGMAVDGNDLKVQRNDKDMKRKSSESVLKDKKQKSVQNKEENKLAPEDAYDRCKCIVDVNVRIPHCEITDTYIVSNLITNYSVSEVTDVIKKKTPVKTLDIEQYVQRVVSSAQELVRNKALAMNLDLYRNTDNTKSLKKSISHSKTREKELSFRLNDTV